MKTIEQVRAETPVGDVYTLDECIENIEDGFFTHYDGYGRFHDGEKETELYIWDDSLTWDDVKDMPYVIWYNR